MLLPEQVVPLLAHDDLVVFEFAVGYLSSAHDVGNLTADLVWHAADDAARRKGALRLLASIPTLTRSQPDLDRLLNAFTKGDEDTQYQLRPALAELDWGLLTQCHEQILSALADAGLQDHLRQRLAMADTTGRQAWEALLQLADKRDLEASGDEDDYDEDADANANADADDASASEKVARDQDEIARLLEVIVRDPAGIAELAAVVASGPKAAGTWREVFAVRLLGHLRHAPAVQLLVKKLGIDDDMLREDAQKAIARIGNVEAVDALERLAASREWHVRLYAHAPLADIKRPESEQALGRLLAVEKSDKLRLFLLGHLAGLGSLAGLDAVSKLMQTSPDDREVLGTAEEMLAVATALGQSIPDADAWHAALRRHDERVQRRMNMSVAELFAEIRPGAQQKVTLDDVYRDQAMRFVKAVAAGRNDPCPCGSGKKYKKCCLAD